MEKRKLAIQMHISKILFLFLLSFFVLNNFSALAQDEQPEEGQPTVLLLDLGVQIESNDAIDDMYNFNFEYAERQFRWLKKKYGWHPLPYFLMGLSQWWKIMPNMDDESYDDAFFSYMDSALIRSERIYEQVNKIEGAFFLAASYAFKGRLYAERREFRKAATAGKRALKYLKVSRGNEAFSPEILFGDALFNYYAEWIPDNYTMLKPIMALFPDGDLKLGLQQLRQVSRNAFYTRTEALYFLMRILSTEEDDQYGALEIAKRLTESYPNNPYFHRYYARLLYQLGQFKQAEKESLSILNKIDSAYTGYESNSGRYASFFLGQIYNSRRNYDDAEKYFLKSIDFGDRIEAQKKGYYQHSLYTLAQIAEKRGMKEKAIDYYERTRQVTSRSQSINKRSRDRVKKLKKELKD